MPARNMHAPLDVTQRPLKIRGDIGYISRFSYDINQENGYTHSWKIVRIQMKLRDDVGTCFVLSKDAMSLHDKENQNMMERTPNVRFFFRF